MNERFVKPLPGAVLFRARFQFRDTLNQPQPMWLVPGMVLQGCSQSKDAIVNGVLYEVTSVSFHGEAQRVWVRMLERYRQEGDYQQSISLSDVDASRMLRLTHCVTYRSAQGCTIGDDTPVLLLDTAHKYLDHRMLIVGLSRVASGSQLRVATRAQQQEAFGWAGQAREDTQWAGSGDTMSPLLSHSGGPERDAESDAAKSESESESWPPPFKRYESDSDDE